MWILIILFIIVILIHFLSHSQPYTNESWEEQINKDYDEKKWKEYYDKYEKHK